LRCSKCGDKIRRLSRNKWGCINCMWHGRSKRRPVTIGDLFVKSIARMLGGK
jgi:ribosomal protein L37AE/L43A